MEDILASIRRIIDDDDQPASSGPSAQEEPAASPAPRDAGRREIDWDALDALIGGEDADRAEGDGGDGRALPGDATDHRFAEDRADDGPRDEDAPSSDREWAEARSEAPVEPGRDQEEDDEILELTDIAAALAREDSRTEDASEAFYGAFEDDSQGDEDSAADDDSAILDLTNRLNDDGSVTELPSLEGGAGAPDDADEQDVDSEWRSIEEVAPTYTAPEERATTQGASASLSEEELSAARIEYDAAHDRPPSHAETAEDDDDGEDDYHDAFTSIGARPSADVEEPEGRGFETDGVSAEAAEPDPLATFDDENEEEPAPRSSYSGDGRTEEFTAFEDDEQDEADEEVISATQGFGDRDEEEATDASLLEEPAAFGGHGENVAAESVDDFEEAEEDAPAVNGPGAAAAEAIRRAEAELAGIHGNAGGGGADDIEETPASDPPTIDAAEEEDEEDAYDAYEETPAAVAEEEPAYAEAVDPGYAAAAFDAESLAAEGYGAFEAEAEAEPEQAMGDDADSVIIEGGEIDDGEAEEGEVEEISEGAPHGYDEPEVEPEGFDDAPPPLDEDYGASLRAVAEGAAFMGAGAAAASVTASHDAEPPRAERTENDDEIETVGGMVREAMNRDVAVRRDMDNAPAVPRRLPPDDTALVSHASEEATARALAALADAEGEASRRIHGKIAVSDGPDSDSIEGMVRQMLKPMLRDWLDENLPSMVEGMVRSEVERISSRARKYARHDLD